MKKTLVLLAASLMVLAFHSLSFSATISDVEFTFKQTSFRDKPVTSFSLAGLGVDGSNTAVDVFTINLRNNSSTDSVRSLRLWVSVYLNGTMLYRARSSTFGLAPSQALPPLTSSDFFNFDRSHPAEGGFSDFKLDQATLQSIGLTNLLAAPSGVIRIEAVLCAGKTLTNPVLPIRDHLYAEYNIVVVPEITILGPFGELPAESTPWFRWQSVLDATNYADNKYRLEIFAEGGTDASAPIYSIDLSVNNFLYPAVDVPTLVPGSIYAWRITALLEGPNTIGYDERLKSQLVTFYYPALPGQTPVNLAAAEVVEPPASAAVTEAAITVAVAAVEDMIAEVRAGGTMDPVKLTQAIATLDGQVETDITFEGKKIAITELAQIINLAMGGGDNSVTVTTQIDTTTPPSASQLKAAGSTARELKTAGSTAIQLKAAGYTVTELKAAGFTAAQLKAASYTASQLKAAGFAASQLKKAGFIASQLKGAEFTATELKAAGYTAPDLIPAGFTAAELKTAGFSANKLQNAGFSAAQLKNAGFTLAALKSAGFTAAELKAAEFTATDLKAAGFSASKLKAAGFSETEIKAAGF